MSPYFPHSRTLYNCRSPSSCTFCPFLGPKMELLRTTTAVLRIPGPSSTCRAHQTTHPTKRPPQLRQRATSMAPLDPLPPQMGRFSTNVLNLALPRPTCDEITPVWPNSALYIRGTDPAHVSMCFACASLGLRHSQARTMVRSGYIITPRHDQHAPLCNSTRRHRTGHRSKAHPDLCLARANQKQPQVVTLLAPGAFFAVGSEPA